MRQQWAGGAVAQPSHARGGRGRAALKATTALVGVAVALAPLHATAIDFTWNAQGGNYRTPGNWTPAGVPDSNADSPVFGATNVGDPTVVIDGAGVTLLQLGFSSSSATTGWTLQDDGTPSIITFATGTADQPAVNVLAGSHRNVNVDWQLNNNTTFNAAANSALRGFDTVVGAAGGNFDINAAAGDLIKAGAGTLIVTSISGVGNGADDDGDTIAEAVRLQAGTLGITTSLATPTTVSMTAGATVDLTAETGQAGNSAINGRIVGNGTLRISSDTVTVILDGDGSNDNSFTGQVSLDSGTVLAGSTNAFGGTNLLDVDPANNVPNTIVVGSSTPLRDDNMTQQQAPALGANVAALNLANPIQITGRQLTLTGGNDFTLSGVVSGTQGLAKNGVSNVTLSGANTFTGGINVSAGTLTAANNTAFGVGNNVNLTGTGQISAGASTVGVGSLTGVVGTTVNTGTGTLTTDTAGNTTFGGTLAGTGTLAKSGTGTLTLTANNAAYGGATNIIGGQISLTGAAQLGGGGAGVQVTGGTLDVGAGTQVSAATSMTAGLIRGTGTVSGAVTQTGGAISPAGSGAFGTLNLTNGGVALNQTGGSTVLNVGPDNVATDKDVLALTGTGVLAGIVIQPIAGAAPFRPGVNTYDNVITSGGALAAPASVTINSAVLTAVAVSDGNNIDLQVSRRAYATATTSSTGAAVGSALDAALTNPNTTAEFNQVLSNLDTLPTGQAEAAINQLSGESNLAFQTANVAAGTQFLSVVNQRLNGLRFAGNRTGNDRNARNTGNSNRRTSLAQLQDELHDVVPAPMTNSGFGGPQLALAPGDKLQTDNQPYLFAYGSGFLDPRGFNPRSRVGAWGRAYGVFGEREGNSVASEYDYTLAGTAFGVDYRLTPQLMAGVTGGYSSTDLKAGALGDEGNVRSFQAGVYGTYFQGPFYANGSISFGNSNNENNRSVTVGALTRQAQAEYDSNEWSFYGETGYSFLSNGVEIQPIASLQVTQVTRDAYTERNAGGVGLTVAESEETSTVGSLGMRVAYQIRNNENTITPEARIRWSHEFGDAEPEMTASFIGAPGASFSLKGAELPRDRFSGGVGVSALIRDYLRLFVNYDIEFSDDSTAQGVSGGFRYQF